MKNTTIDKYFELMIYAHRDLYPRDYWIGGTILKPGYSPDFKEYENEYTVLDGQHFIYPELEKVKRVIKNDKDDFDYTFEYIYEFNESLSLNEIIEKALQGKEYTKTEELSYTSYRLENSPIDSIKTGSDFLSFTINEDYYRYRML
ncbi:hypothetical protein [Olleya sp. R77988]|uniref:hypothetical protein n=1 Tax=Olleya sp. R77988 TaxID=3093875 RepID=UPI0037CA9D84